MLKPREPALSERWRRRCSPTAPTREQILGLNGKPMVYAQAIAKMTALGRDPRRWRLAIRNNWAIASLTSGDIKGALALYRGGGARVASRDQTRRCRRT